MTKFIKLTALSINLKETDRDHPGLGCTKKERDDYYQYLKEFCASKENYDIKKYPMVFNVDEISIFAKRTRLQSIPALDCIPPDDLNLGSVIKIKNRNNNENYRGHATDVITVEESVAQILELIQAANRTNTE